MLTKPPFQVQAKRVEVFYERGHGLPQQQKPCPYSLFKL